MSNLQSDFQRLVDEVTERLQRQGRKFQVHQYGKRPKRQYSLRAPKTFAWVNKKPMLDCLAIGTKQEWADKAGLNDYDYKPNSQFNGPGAHWKVSEGDIKSLQDVAGYLAKVCEARHS